LGAQLPVAVSGNLQRLVPQKSAWSGVGLVCKVDSGQSERTEIKVARKTRRTRKVKKIGMGGLGKKTPPTAHGARQGFTF